MTVLVTGAAGFVGSHLIELLERDSADIVGWLRPGTEPLVRGDRTRWIDIEMHNRDAVTRAIAESKPAAVYHLAGVPHVGDSWAHVQETFAGNVLATHHLFEAL
ncbi:MAG TPA: NAD-dependent epimerase/dehydratase family protein, partial [Vicinamibacterales bacterium]